MKTKYHIIKKVILTCCIVFIMLVFLYVRYGIGEIGPGFNYNYSESPSSYDFMLEMGKINDVAHFEKVINKFTTNTHSTNFNEVYCIKIANFPKDLNSKQKNIWYEYPLNDSSLIEILIKTLSFSKEPEDLEILLNDLDEMKLDTNKFDWIPSIKDLNQDFLIMIDSLNENKINRNKLLLYDKKRSFLFYYNISFL